MTTTAPDQRRRSRTMQLILAGVAALAVIALFAPFDAARPDTTHAVLGAPFGGYAADDDDQAQQQAQLQEQLALQQMQQSMQQAEQQNEAAQQQFEQDMQQAQLTEQQANNP
jgi:hypothetical protein